MRGRATALLGVLLAGSSLGLVACQKDASSGDAPEVATTTGGEAGGEHPAPGTDGAASSPGDDGHMGTEASGSEPTAGDGDATAADAPSPWGMTRAEQCKPPPRKTIQASAQAAIRQGVQAGRSGDAPAARAAFQQAIGADPNAYEAHHNLGVLADRAGQPSQALEHYRQALRAQPDYERAARGVVAIHLRRGDANEARRFADALASQFPTNLELQALFAETLVRAGRHDDAYRVARKALECDERFVPAMIALVKASLELGRKELAESVLDQALQIYEHNAELHFLKGEMLREEDGRLRDALDRYRRALKLRPAYLEARIAYGIQLLSGGNYPEALAQLQAAAALAPTMVAVHLNLGDAYRATQQWDKARQSFEKALSMEPKLPQAHFNMALMYLTALGDYPGLSELDALRKARQELLTYRNLMGPRLPKDDPSASYLADIDRQIERTERRLEREAAAKQRDAERAARQQAEGAAAPEGATSE
jgi:tetratricopeptide (TPR) repeat protein